MFPHYRTLPGHGLSLDAMDACTRGPDSGGRQEVSETPSFSTTQLALSAGCQEGSGTTTALVLSAAPAVYDISPSTALELLCMNVENLGKSMAEDSKASLGTAEPTPVGLGQTNKAYNGEESISLRVTELHFSQATDHAAGQAKHDLIQQGLLTKKFLSKREPPIPLKDYLLRLHQYCPMSTAVYLATSVYITKMVAIEGVISVIPRNIHRLVLAGLRVAMKALEDLSYPHSRFAKVGGVSERELSRLEISFCFLADFDLRVDSQMLINEARSIQSRMEAFQNMSHSQS